MQLTTDVSLAVPLSAKTATEMRSHDLRVLWVGGRRIFQSKEEFDEAMRSLLLSGVRPASQWSCVFMYIM